MTPRTLARELKDHPATVSLCAIWIAVFAAMTYCDLADHDPSLTPVRWLFVGFPGGERFGDLSIAALGRGQVWRLITCNFLHFSLIHLGLNLLAMYQIGSMVEEWYGSHQFLFIYAVMGGGGNLVSAGIRHAMGSSPEVHSGGGSVIIMGLVGMCAVVGWRVRDRWGKQLSRMMTLFLVLTAIMGLLLPRYIDNWGHAGGALMGAPLGLADRRLIANRSRPSAWGMGLVAGLIMAACGTAQFIVDRREAPARLERALVARSDHLARAVHDLILLRQFVDRGDDPREILRFLDRLEAALDRPARDELRGLRPIVAGALGRPFSDEETRRIKEGLQRSIREVGQLYRAQQRRIRELPAGIRAR